MVNILINAKPWLMEEMARSDARSEGRSPWLTY
jgi:hypothetical protein